MLYSDPMAGSVETFVFLNLAFAGFVLVAFFTSILHRKFAAVRSPNVDTSLVVAQMGKVRSLRQHLSAREQEIARNVAEIRRLETEIARLQRRVEEQRRTIDQLRSSRASPDRAWDARFQQLRTLVLRELHPDHASEGSVDRALREAAFKSLWPKIESLGRPQQAEPGPGRDFATASPATSDAG